MNLRQGTARTILIGPILDSAGVAKTDEVVGSLKATKNGSVASLNGSATLTHNHAGKYLLALTTSDTDTLGCLQISLNSGTNDMKPQDMNVMPAAAWDALYAATGGILPADMAKILGTAPTEGASGRLAAAFTKFGDVATPVFTAASVNQTVDASSNIQLLARALMGAKGSVLFVGFGAANDSGDGLNIPTAKQTLAGAIAVPPVSGDALMMSAGTFAQATNQQIVPNGVKVRGAGMSQTIITSTLQDNAACVVTRSNSVVEDVKVSAISPSAGHYAFPVGAYGSDDGTSTNVTYRRVWITGDTDGIYLSASGNQRWRFESCLVETLWDGVYIGAAGYTVDLYDTEVRTVGPSTAVPTAGSHCILSASAGSKVNVYGGRLSVSGSPTENIGVVCTNGTVELWNTVISPSGTGALALKQSGGGIIIVHDCVYDPSLVSGNIIVMNSTAPIEAKTILIPAQPAAVGSEMSLINGAITAGKIEAGSLNGKGDWSTFAAGDNVNVETIKGRAIQDVGLGNTVYVGTVAFPSNWATLATTIAANQHVIVDSGTVTTLTNAPSDSSGVTELLTRIPDATAGQAGGLLIAGSNASTTFNTLTLTSGTIPVDVQTIKTRAVTDVGLGNTVYLGTSAWSTLTQSQVSGGAYDLTNATFIAALKSGLGTIPASGNWLTDKTGYSLASSQHVIVDSGTVTTLTNAPSDSAGVTELLTRIPDATAGQTGGLLIAGSNAATTLASLTITSGNLPADVKAYTVQPTVSNVTLAADQAVNVTKWNNVGVGGMPNSGKVAVSLASGDVSGYLPVNVIQIAGQTANAAGAVTFPSSIGTSTFTIGGSVVVSDKTGFKLASDGLDSIALTAPTGVATTFREMMVQLFWRFFGRATKTTAQIKTYNPDSDSVATTQTITDDGAGNETQGKAS